MEKTREEERKVIKIPKRILERIEQDLKKDKDLEELASRYQPYEYQSWTAEFDDGMEMDIKVCCGNLTDLESNPLWAEAVLFDHGQEISCTDPEEDFAGEWMLESDAKAYWVEVIADEDTEEKLLIEQNEDGTIEGLLKVKNYDPYFENIYQAYVEKWWKTKEEFHTYMNKAMKDFGYEVESLDYETVATYV